MSTMADKWAAFERMTIAPGTAPEEVEKQKRAWYAGAAMTFHQFTELSKAQSGPAGIQAMSNEIAGTLAELTRRRAAAQADAARKEGRRPQ